MIFARGHAPLQESPWGIFVSSSSSPEKHQFSTYFPAAHPLSDPGTVSLLSSTSPSCSVNRDDLFNSKFLYQRHQADYKSSEIQELRIEAPVAQGIERRFPNLIGHRGGKPRDECDLIRKT